MPILDARAALAARIAPIPYVLAPRDVALYGLAVGAGRPATDPRELRFCTAQEPLALPTFGVIPAFVSLWGFVAGGIPGIEIDLASMVHGEQRLEIRKHPIPVEGTLWTEPRVAGVYDKGRSALVAVEATTRDAVGDDVFFNRFGIFLRGEGGFGGERGPTAAANEPPRRRPDAVFEDRTEERQALFYRLLGDDNPLHSDPGFARMAGFERPILHGLCSFAFAARAVLRAYCGNDPARLRAVEARFSHHLYPGETLATRMWREGGRVLFASACKERGGDVLAHGAAEIA